MYRFFKRNGLKRDFENIHPLIIRIYKFTNLIAKSVFTNFLQGVNTTSSVDL